MADDTPPVFDPKLAQPYTEDAETPPAFDPKLAQPIAPVQSSQDTSPEAEFKDQVSGLDPTNARLLQSIPGVGGAVASFADAMSRPIEAAMAAPQYVANKFDQYVPGNLANTGLEMMMAGSGEGSIESGLHDAKTIRAIDKDYSKGDFSRLDTPTPEAPSPEDVAQISHQNAANLQADIAAGYDSDTIAKKYPGIDKAALDKVVEARNKGQAYSVGQNPSDVRNPLQGDPTNDGQFDAGDRNAAELGDQKPDPNNPLTQQAAAFTPAAEPTPADLFKSEDYTDDQKQAITDKLQAQADTFQANKSADTPPVFDPAEAQPLETPTSNPTIPAPTDPDRLDDLQHAEDVHNHIEDISSDWTNKPTHQVYPTTEDISDPQLKAAFESDPNIKGAYDAKNGTVHIVADRFEKPEEVAPVFYHEALAHHGLASKFGDTLDTHLVDFYHNGDKDFKSAVDDWDKNHPGAYPGDDHLARVAEEVLAERTEKTGALTPGLGARLRNTVKQFGRQMGLKLKYSNDEINTILGMAHQATVDGADSAAANGFKFSRQFNPERLDHRGEDDTLSYDNGRTNDFRRFSTEELRDATSNDRADGRADWKAVIKDDRKNSRRVGESDRAFWAAKRNNLTPEENDGKIVNPDGRTGWQSAMVDQRRGSRAQRAADQEFWQGKKANKTPEEWEAEQASQGLKFSRISREKGRAEDSENDTTKNMVGGFNLDKVSTVHDIGTVAQELLSKSETNAPMSMADAKVEGAAMGLRVNGDKISKKGSVAGLTSIADLPARVDALRQLHVNFQEDIAKTYARLQDNFNDADHANAIAKLSKTMVIDAQLREDREAIGRSLNMFKRVVTSTAKQSELLKAMSKEGGIEAFLADKDNFMKFMAQLNSLGHNTPAGAANLVQALTKPYWWEKVLTGRNAAMLSGMSTHAKNSLDNAGLMTRDFIDHVGASMVPGSGVTKTELLGRMHALWSGVKDWQAHKAIIQSVVNGGQQDGKFGGGHAYVPIASHSLAVLEGADHFMKNLHTGMALRALGIRQAQREGLTGAAALKRGEFLANNPSQTFMDSATNTAKINLLQGKTAGITNRIEGLKAIRPGMTPYEQATAFGAHIVFPFIRVADRDIAQRLNRTPLGLSPKFNARLAEAIKNGDKAEIARARASAVIGTAVVAYYATKAFENKVTGANPNYAKANAEGASGYMPNSVDDGDRYTDATAVGTSVNPFDLHNQTAASVASFVEAYKHGGSYVDMAKGLGEAAVNMFNTNTVLSDVAPYATAAGEIGKGDPRGAAASTGSALVASFFPAAIRQFNQSMVDTTKRVTTGDKSLGDRITGAVMSAIPGESTKLPVSYDQFGQVNTTGKSFSGVSNFNMKSTDPTVNEVSRLEALTPNKTLVGQAPTNPWKAADGGSIKLTAAQQSEFQRRSGTYFKATMDSYVSNPAWAGASVAVKKEYVKDALKNARQQAKSEMLQDGTVPQSQETSRDTSDESIQ